MDDGTVPDPTDEVAEIIASFRRPDYRIIDMERDGFTHVGTECARCDRIIEMPFELLRKRKNITDETTLADIAKAFRCSNCGGKSIVDGLPQPCYQYMGTPDDDDDDSPVNRRLGSQD